VQEAKAKMDSAKLLAGAEVERAKGVAEANKIVAESLKDHDEYLRYLWITEVAGKGEGKTVVYVPTEANLPILEASRFAPAQ
jgi:regulator of protease activity HflC (stomatin/prohibitin superfamily)